MTEFQEKVLNYLQLIPSNKVVTYAQVAAGIGHPGACRAVGTALHRNPDGDLYPCYKVVSADGSLAADFVFGGPGAQEARLRADGIEVIDGKVNLKKYQW